MRALLAWLLKLWTVWPVHRPPRSAWVCSRLAGSFAAMLFWGAFNTAWNSPTRETFCLSCHEMRNNVYQELSRTVHFSNRSGVRAICSDCHVPHNWTDKIARKMQASKEVWGHLFGTHQHAPEVPRPPAGAGATRMGADEGEQFTGMPQLPFRARPWT